MKLVWGTVVGVEEERSGLQRLSVDVEGATGVAVCYPQLTGGCRPGEKVLLNTTAVDLSLGTGGAHFVVAREGSGVVLDDPSGGHIMKLRYTPLQRDVMAVESQESPYHASMLRASRLDGMPVVCCGLHSQVPAVAAGLKESRPDQRVAYVMTDESSLSLALSDSMARCVEKGLIDATITAGQAFGGTHEAVNTYSALLAARFVARADVAVTGIGPGVVGSATAFGHGGVAQGVAVNAAAALGGRPLAVLRVSFADARGRHRGVSHHSLTALTRVAMARATVAVPALPEDQAAEVEAALDAGGVWEMHDRVDVGASALPDTRGVELRSMGRRLEDDPAFFLAAAAAGRVAASMCESAG